MITIKEKVVLAYSGGLDTSVILSWLIEQGHEVIAYIADVGQQEDFTAIKKKALSCGASKAILVDLKKEFVTDFIFPAIKSHAIYEGKYLLGTSLARPLIAKGQVEVAKKEKATALSHGATGKGNDQVRFEMTYEVLMPSAKIIAPWKNPVFLKQFQGRSDLIAYAEKKGIPVKATAKKPYSTDENLMHISFEAGVLEDPGFTPEEDMFEKSVSIEEASAQADVISIEFKDGVAVKLTEGKKALTDPLLIFSRLNELGGKHGIGRVDLVENRFVGMKSRGVYETPGGTILMHAHLDIEGITMDREVKLLRDSLSPKFAQLVYNGFWYSPEMKVLSAFMNAAQEGIYGTVKLKLLKGNVIIQGRESKNSLYNQGVASMDKAGGYNQQDADGFIRLNALRLAAWAKRK